MKEKTIERIKKEFVDNFFCEPEVISRAPGRLEILGNHTDYNEGLVLSCAVSQSTFFAIKPNNANQIRILNSQFNPQIEVIKIDEVDKKISGDWKNYIKGVICEIRKKTGIMPCFDAVIYSDVPVSAGMSSSAAIEVSACMAIAKAYGLKLSPVEIAKIGQGAENNFVGAHTGLLDQFSSVFGKKDSLILCDFRKNEVLRNVPLPENYSIIVVNSMIKHDLVASDYNLRRKSCENVVAEIAKFNSSVKALRDLTVEQLDSYRDKLAIFDYRKAKHVVEENERVLKAVEYLDSRRYENFGKLLYQSHQSSRFNFENSCPELDYLIEVSQSIPGCLGARLSGGGFGGITIHFVENQQAQDYERRIKTAYQIRTDISPQTIISSAGDGAEILS